MTDDKYYDEVKQPDAYKRERRVATVGGLLGQINNAEVDEFRKILQLDDREKWDAYDRRIAEQLAREKADEVALELRRRAQLFKTDEHRFPAIAVEAALAVWPQPTPAMAQGERFMRSPWMILVLGGGVGVGKSCAATRIALEIGGSSPAFLRASELEARGRYDAELRSWLRSRSMLVLDDLGAEVLDGKRVFQSLLDELVDIFYGDRKRLVITTNLRKRCEKAGEELQFVERYGERVTSRLVEVGLWADCGATDLRRDKRG